jgi:ubiquitin carboxyl-terminal hydrolase 8
MTYIINTDFSKYIGHGYSGLKNLGNTCFLNSSIQVLNHTYELIELLKSQRTKDNLNIEKYDHYINTEFIELNNNVMEKNGIIMPNRFVECVHAISTKKGRDLFTGWAQNDMPEFLLFIIECLHNSISRPVTLKIKGTCENSKDEMALKCLNMLSVAYEKDYSEIMHLFYGIYVSQIKSISTKDVLGVNSENYFMIDLPIPIRKNHLQNIKQINLYDCFDLYTQEEILEGDNAYFNSKTNAKENVTKNITFWSFPQILVITLKRFYVSNIITKIEDFIDFPLENLDLSKYCSGYNPQSYVYDLYGICNHYGNTMGGHYTAFVKNAEKKWVHYNDEQVHILLNNSIIKTNNAYCLFYRKKNSGL